MQEALHTWQGPHVLLQPMRNILAAENAVIQKKLGAHKDTGKNLIESISHQEITLNQCMASNERQGSECSVRLSDMRRVSRSPPSKTEMPPRIRGGPHICWNKRKAGSHRAEKGGVASGRHIATRPQSAMGEWLRTIHMRPVPLLFRCMSGLSQPLSCRLS